MLCPRIAGGTAACGSLSLISKTAGAFDDQSGSLAAVLAAHAAIALAAAESVRQLQAALGRPGLIGQAKGILMERYRLTPDAAFGVLARVSQDANRKL